MTEPIHRDLSHEISGEITDLLHETAITHKDWWELALRIRQEVYKLEDRRESIQDPVYLSMCDSLIRDGMMAYNNIISIFVNAGMQSHGLKSMQRRAHGIQVVRGSIVNGSNSKA